MKSTAVKAEPARMGMLRAGDKVRADAGFTCMAAGVKMVHADHDGDLWIQCHEGQHYLSGQLYEDENDKLMGLYPVSAATGSGPGSREEQA